MGNLRRARPRHLVPTSPRPVRTPQSRGPSRDIRSRLRFRHRTEEEGGMSRRRLGREAAWPRDAGCGPRRS